MTGALKILVADDQPDGIEVLKLAFKRAGLKAVTSFVGDGQETIEYLQGAGRFADRTRYPFPEILLLDLKMPRVDGFEVLEWLRLQPGLQCLIVIVFTSSAEPRDINRAYRLGANSYVAKPGTFDQLVEFGRLLERYWLDVNLCPDCHSTQRRRPGSRIFIRDGKTNKYFKGAGQWTVDVEEALDFERSERAMQTAQELRIPSLEVVIKLRNEPREDLRSQPSRIS